MENKTFGIASNTVVGAIVLWTTCVMGGPKEHLMGISMYIPSDDLTINDKCPSPLLVKEKYKMTDEEFLAAITELSKKDVSSDADFFSPKDMEYFSADEREEFKQVSRARSVVWIGEFGSTNNLPYLKTIMTNSNDCAQQEAVGAGLHILHDSPDLIPFARDVITNDTVYVVGIRRWASCQLADMCNPIRHNFSTNQVQRARIAAFAVEMASVGKYTPLGADQTACDLNPWYRHSQQRRNNLARLRPPGLTGRPAEIYDAAQRDAAQED